MHERDIEQSDDDKIHLVGKIMDLLHERSHLGESVIGWYHNECHTFIVLNPSNFGKI
jgi:hypothetical protein